MDSNKTRINYKWPQKGCRTNENDLFNNLAMRPEVSGFIYELDVRKFFFLETLIKKLVGNLNFEEFSELDLNEQIRICEVFFEAKKSSRKMVCKLLQASIDSDTVKQLLGIEPVKEE